MTLHGDFPVGRGALQPAGKSIIATSESRTNTAFGTLATPDQVTGVVMPTDGLIVVQFHAHWRNSVASAGRAAIFIDSNQLSLPQPINPPTQGGQQAIGSSGTGIDDLLGTFRLGLASHQGQGVTMPADVTTGQVVGGNDSAGRYEIGVSGALGDGGVGPCYIFAAAGSHTISVQYKSSSGSVTASVRKLWVWTMDFT